MKQKTDTKIIAAKNASPDTAVDTFKKKALEVTFAQIDKQYGAGAVMLLGQTHQGPSKRYQLAQFKLIRPLVLAAFLEVASLKFMALNQPGKQP